MSKDKILHESEQYRSVNGRWIIQIPKFYKVNFDKVKKVEDILDVLKLVLMSLDLSIPDYKMTEELKKYCDLIE